MEIKCIQGCLSFFVTGVKPPFCVHCVGLLSALYARAKGTEMSPSLLEDGPGIQELASKYSSKETFFLCPLLFD